jgi:hypothetical protein
MENNNIVDELLNKLKALEDRNALLRSDIETVKSQISDSKNTKQEEEKVELEDGKIYYNLLEMHVEGELLYPSSEMLKITQNKEMILENLKEHVITFMPYEQFNTMWIMGDFTQWEPNQMTRNKDIFSFKTVLIKGYKYYFSFTAKDQVIIDHNSDYENNPRSNQPNNFIEVKKDDSAESLQGFDYKLHSNLLEENKRIFTKARMGEEKEVLALEKAIDFANRYNQRLNYLMTKKEDLSNKISNFYE